MNLNIDFYGGKSILPVFCGECRGTAFYIGEKRFLTAWHIVSEGSDEDGVDIIIKREQGDIACRLIELGEKDIALLEADEEINDITPIPLLKTDFKPYLKLKIIGYPQELGNGLEYFGVNCKNYRTITHSNDGFDTIVLRTDPFGFHSYSGFSGSPVLNTKGFAVGVVTDQLHNTLGYTSIDSVTKVFDIYGVEYSVRAEQNDTRPVGIGRCMKLAEESLNRMISRYDNKCHVEDVWLERQMELFCGYDIYRERDKLRDDLNYWYNHLTDKYKKYVDTFQTIRACLDGGDFNNDDLIGELAALRSYQDEKAGQTFIPGIFLKKLFDLEDYAYDVKEIERFTNTRFLYIHGDAGCGKTHHMCYAVARLSEFVNVYLLFGTDFHASESPVDTILQTPRWGGDITLEALNDEMRSKGRYATFIIDALNEGEGTYIWNSKLLELKSTFDKLERLKLVVTVRSMEPHDNLHELFRDGWQEIEVGGFSDLPMAIKTYFDVSKIHEEPNNYFHIKEFQKPLFLKIFCDVYFHLRQDLRKDIDILYLYELYFESRNEEISIGADEDPEKWIAPNMMYKLGGCSLLSYHCYDVPRKKAIAIANKICHYRTWSKSLYHCMLKSNLIMEYKTKNGMMTTFQYDSMGDYVRCKMILDNNKWDDYGCLHQLLRLADSIKSVSETEGNKIKNTIICFLSVWNPSVDIWNRSEFCYGILTHFLLQSMTLRNMKSKRSTLPKGIVADIIRKNTQYLKPEFLLDNFELFHSCLEDDVHEFLMEMTMRERDENWSISVNEMYDRHSLLFKINKLEISDDERQVGALLTLFLWMLSASHPQLRYLVLRRINFFLKKYPELCLLLIQRFFQCNDAYVLQGVYSSIYGVLLVIRDADLTHRIAELLFAKLYHQQMMVPNEISVRSWTLRILEFNHLMNPDDNYWEKATPPYRRDDNMMSFPAEESFNDNNYFGNNNGAHCMHHSLFHWDFNWYVIGTNSRTDSETYFKDGVAVKLEDITNAVAYRIKHGIGYSDILGEYDARVKWDDRPHHYTERFGKKYQWIALGEVKAYLCDTCQMNKTWWSNNGFVDIPYPWYDADKITYDPTLMMYGNKPSFDSEKFKEVKGQDLIIGEPKEWLESREIMPEPCIIVKDINDTDWVNIVGYQRTKDSKEKDKREIFVFICPCLVKNENANAFELWAKEQCFYGRWMPEDKGQYDYLWNEYPWSDRYRSLDFEDEIEISRGNGIAPCSVILPYGTQMQEYSEGIEDEDAFQGMVYMPSSDMFEYFDLHTAERGVTRNAQGDIVALERDIPGDTLDTLVMKRSMLNDYLEARHYTLFYCMLAQKQLIREPQTFNIQRLSCCMKYNPQGNPIVVQPMKDERDFVIPK